MYVSSRLESSRFPCSVAIAEHDASHSWSFARDGGLPYSKHVGSVHPTLHVPVIPLLISWTGVTILGALYVASTTVYNSIIACCIILGNVSFAIPSVQLMLRGRKMREGRWLRLGVLGWVVNGVTVAWTAITLVMWLFPLDPDPSPADMSEHLRIAGNRPWRWLELMILACRLQRRGARGHGNPRGPRLGCRATVLLGAGCRRSRADRGRRADEEAV
jgi:hypothetical protein